ncbi:MAG: class I SAM-dependent rRNA methyltransferase [bacterium]|nr:class I SAM-dependent rRNA methyltransferase [bacterium]
MSEMAYPEVHLKLGREKQIFEGHPWVFAGAVARRPESAEPGGIVDVIDARGRFVARGYYNPKSSIPVRLLTRDAEQRIDRTFLIRRIQEAYDLRRNWLDLRNTNAYRVVHGENDFLPGLIVDRYADFLVVQFHTLGMDRLRDLILEALQEVMTASGIFERSDVGTRRPEGLETQPVGLLAGQEPPEWLEITEYRTRFWVDLRGGQKTGFFLDQRENRLAAQGFAKGRSVLNLFSYSGGFSVYAARGKAQRVVSVDVSEPAVELARRNLELNRLNPEDHPCIAANVFDYLKECRTEEIKYDMVIVDPPAFVKNQEALGRAMKAYISLNRRAIELLNPGGVLVSASCSTQVDYETFFTILKHAATAAKREVQIVKSHLQAVDHPTSTAFPEGRYLKCLFGVVR